MTCEEAKYLISEIGQIPTDKMKELETHLSGCENCRGVKATIGLFQEFFESQEKSKELKQKIIDFIDRDISKKRIYKRIAAAIVIIAVSVYFIASVYLFSNDKIVIHATIEGKKYQVQNLPKYIYTKSSSITYELTPNSNFCAYILHQTLAQPYPLYDEDKELLLTNTTRQTVSFKDGSTRWFLFLFSSPQEKEVVKEKLKELYDYIQKLDDKWKSQQLVQHMHGSSIEIVDAFVYGELYIIDFRQKDVDLTNILILKQFYFSRSPFVVTSSNEIPSYYAFDKNDAINLQINFLQSSNLQVFTHHNGDINLVEDVNPMKKNVKNSKLSLKNLSVPSKDKIDLCCFFSDKALENLTVESLKQWSLKNYEMFEDGLTPKISHSEKVFFVRVYRK